MKSPTSTLSCKQHLADDLTEDFRFATVRARARSLHFHVKGMSRISGVLYFARHRPP